MSTSHTARPTASGSSIAHDERIRLARGIAEVIAATGEDGGESARELHAHLRGMLAALRTAEAEDPNAPTRRPSSSQP